MGGRPRLPREGTVGRGDVIAGRPGGGQRLRGAVGGEERALFEVGGCVCMCVSGGWGDLRESGRKFGDPPWHDRAGEGSGPRPARGVAGTWAPEQGHYEFGPLEGSMMGLVGVCFGGYEKVGSEGQWRREIGPLRRPV